MARMFVVREAQDSASWEAFLAAQPYRPFLQSWTMGEVYRDVGQMPLRFEVLQDNKVVGVCFAHVVPARRGKHLAIPYGPVVQTTEALPALFEALRTAGSEHGCRFLRLSPFWPARDAKSQWLGAHAVTSPLHLLAEHTWYLPLTASDAWAHPALPAGDRREAEEIFSKFRSTTRNLIRRAEKEGVTIETSSHPEADVEHFIRLHDETRKRHGFTPYTNTFFRSELAHFSDRNAATLYLARYQGEVIAAAMHIHMYGETSYHHGASTHRFSKIPASYLLQWHAIQDALRRGDHVYNFWGIAPVNVADDGKVETTTKKHPFAGVTLFKTGYGGALLELLPCHDVPLHPAYRVTRAIETVRKWKRGF